MLKALETVILMDDLPKNNLKTGDIGTVVMVHHEGYEVEFVTLDGETIAVVTVVANQVQATNAQ